VPRSVRPPGCITDFSGARRIYVRDPRAWKFTLSVDF
jgi:hypothetical protein